ncbi:hypothetical protein K474DRAFT_95044 [Panus rudis PR-1116 ss-1]|nr:hypothetical protein K474DRAFT_95044 [Panus rudis PR-1116 ss-1]
MAYYCSKECQKKDWTRHKIDCMASRANAAEMDRRTTPNMISTVAQPRPVEVAEELTAFRQHFMPALTFAALNCFSKGTLSPEGWEDKIFWVQLVRLSSPTADVPPWSRFHLFGAGQAPVSRVMGGKDPNQVAFRRNRDLAHARNEKEGFGAITVFITCNYQKMGLHVFTDIKFMRNAPTDLCVERVDNWWDIFVNALEREAVPARKASRNVK